MQIVIMAGGLGTRMHPFTKSIPKSLLPINGKPFIDYQLKLFAASGISKVHLCIGHLGEMIQSVVGDGKKWGISVTYSWEKGSLLGTAGALRNAIEYLENDFLFTWGDSYVQLNYEDFFEKHLNSRYFCNVGVFKNKNKWDKSNIIYENGNIILYDKKKYDPLMYYIDVGVSGFNKSIVELIPEGVSSLDDVWRNLSIEGKLGGIEVFTRFYEIGSVQGYFEFIKKVCETK